MDRQKHVTQIWMAGVCFLVIGLIAAFVLTRGAAQANEDSARLPHAKDFLALRDGIYCSTRAAKNGAVDIDMVEIKGSLAIFSTGCFDKDEKLEWTGPETAEFALGNTDQSVALGKKSTGMSAEPGVFRIEFRQPKSPSIIVQDPAMLTKVEFFKIDHVPTSVDDLTAMIQQTTRDFKIVLESNPKQP